MHKRNSYFSNCTLLSSSSSSKRKGCKLFGPVCVCATRAPPSIRSWWNSHTTSTTLSVHCLLPADEQRLRGDWCSGPLCSPAYAVPASTMMSVHFAKKTCLRIFAHQAGDNLMQPFLDKIAYAKTNMFNCK